MYCELLESKGNTVVSSLMSLGYVIYEDNSRDMLKYRDAFDS